MTAVSVVGAESKTVELPDEIFAAKVNVPLIHQVVVAQQAAARQGTHATKTRGEVRGGGRKPYRVRRRLPGRFTVFTPVTLTPNTASTASLIWVLLASGATTKVYLPSSSSP